MYCRKMQKSDVEFPDCRSEARFLGAKQGPVDFHGRMDGSILGGDRLPNNTMRASIGKE